MSFWFEAGFSTSVDFIPQSSSPVVASARVAWSSPPFLDPTLEVLEERQRRRAELRQRRCDADLGDRRERGQDRRRSEREKGTPRESKAAGFLAHAPQF